MSVPERTALCARLLVEPGRFVTTGEALVESEDVTLNAELDILSGRVAELEARLAAERFNDRVRAEFTTTELGQAQAELATATRRAERLFARSRGEGTFAVMKPQDLPGRFLREGQLIGYVLPAGSRIVRATIRQDDIDLVRISCAAPRSSSLSAWMRPCRRASSAKFQPGATTCRARRWAAPAAARSGRSRRLAGHENPAARVSGGYRTA